jgi:tetratricopeptide (TPR) repeat protein
MHLRKLKERQRGLLAVPAWMAPPASGTLAAMFFVLGCWTLVAAGAATAVGAPTVALVLVQPAAGVAQPHETALADSLSDPGGQAGADSASMTGVAEPTVEERIRDLNRKIMQEPRNPDHYNNLGVIYAEQGDWLQARDAFISAVQANPFEADFHRNLAQVLMHLEDYDTAVREFEAYQRFSSAGAADVYRLIGVAFLQADKKDEAAASFRRGLRELGPEHEGESLRLVLALSDLYRDEGQNEDARKVLEEHLDLARQVQAEVAAPGDLEDPPDPLAPSPAEARAEAKTLAGAVLNELLGIYIDDAELLSDSGLPLEAGDQYRKAFELAPQHDELLPHMVRQYIAAAEVAKARLAVRRASETRPQAAGTWIATGMIAENEGRLDEALAAYLKARGIDPGNKSLDLQIGSLYMQLGDARSARQYLEGGIASEAASPEFIYNYAVSLLRERHYNEAVEPLRQVVKREPEMGQAWQALALALRMSDRFGEAVNAYERALSFGPDAKLAFNLAYCLSRQDRTDEAIENYREAIALEPNFPEAYYNLTRIYIQAGRYEEALTVMAEHLKIEPRSYRILFNQGLCYYHLGRYEEAIDSYESALEQKETADLLNNLGLVYDKLGQKEEANAYYREAKKMRGGRS